ncbi:MAG: type II toxin-antitoxin system prevent-host-death family antitoxin [Zoogloeaceae bacterium]|jgi:prevent-host-death family protein|nr:type II toxin-antitoxin system prevent-host-death family antitoxin [Zoogloeaceae bacterium]
MQITATEAKNRFGHMLDACQRSPVVIEKAGRRHGVLLSAQQYDELMTQLQASVSAGRSGRRFYEQYKDWVDMNNALVAQSGIPGQEYRPW